MQTAAEGNAASDAPSDTRADAPAEGGAGGAETASEDLQTDLSVAEPETTPEPENLPAGEAADSDITKDDTVTDETATDKAAGDDTAVTELALAAPPPPPPPPPPAELAPASLIGVTPDMLRARLGEADFARQEGDMKTWQYRFADCVVDYFLFPQDGASRVASWAWRSPVVGMTVDATSCRRALARRDSAGG